MICKIGYLFCWLDSYNEYPLIFYRHLKQKLQEFSMLSGTSNILIHIYWNSVDQTRLKLAL